MKRIVGLLTAMFMAVICGFVMTPVAHATVTAKVSFTLGQGVNVRVTPSRSAAIVSTLREGASVSIECEVLNGESVTSFSRSGSPITTTSIWEKVPGGYISNAYVETGVNGRTPGVAECQPPALDVNRVVSDGGLSWDVYDRTSAAMWAKNHAQDVQPDQFSGCAWFVSNALWAGMPEDGDWNSKPRPIFGLPLKTLPGTSSATAAHNLYDYLANKQHFPVVPLGSARFSANQVPEAMPGDVIFYKWNGNSAKFDHAAFITSISPGHYPNVAEWGTNDGGKLSNYRNGYVERGWTLSAKSGKWLQEQWPSVTAVLVRVGVKK